MRKCIIVIFGPTAVGKTDFAQMLANQFPAEIVNADVGQFYTPLSIGTAKPNWRKSPTAQHLFDIINEPRMISVAHYRDHAKRVLGEIWNRNAIPILVGGSGFYSKSLFFPPELGNPIQNIGQTISKNYSWQDLYQVDPERALDIHENDSYRITRALDIYYATGKKPSDYVPRYQPLGTFCFVYLTRDKQELNHRIGQRTAAMLEEGWLEEAARLKQTEWEPFLKKKKLIGYNDIFDYLDGDQKEKDLQKLIAVIARKTCNYAKRQLTFGNSFYDQLEKMLLENSDTRSSCVRFNLTCSDLELYIKQLLEVVNSMHSFEKR